MKNYLNFENEIKNIELEIDRLKDPYNNEGISTVDTDKIDKLQSELDKKLKEIYSNLNPWQTTLVARHENRPKSKFFIDNLFDNFFPLSGDRLFGEDKSSIAGLANFENNSVLVIAYMAKRVNFKDTSYTNDKLFQELSKISDKIIDVTLAKDLSTIEEKYYIHNLDKHASALGNQKRAAELAPLIRNILSN